MPDNNGILEEASQLHRTRYDKPEFSSWEEYGEAYTDPEGRLTFPTTNVGRWTVTAKGWKLHFLLHREKEKLGEEFREIPFQSGYADKRTDPLVQTHLKVSTALHALESAARGLSIEREEIEVAMDELIDGGYIIENRPV